MDEPTAALSGVEVERLFTVARSLRDEGRALMFISHRFDEVFDSLRHHHRDAGRRLHLHRRCRRHHGRPDRPADGRARHQRALPQAAGRDRRAAAGRRRTDHARGVPRHQLHSPVGRDRRTGRTGRRRPQRGGPGRLRRRPLRGRPGEHRGPAGPARNPSAAMRDGCGAGAGGPAQAGPGRSTPRSPRTSPPRSGSRWPAGADHHRDRERVRPGLGQPAGGEDERARRGGRHAQRRQPAEGRAGQVAGHQPQGADHRRTDPRHRRRAPSPRCTG